MLAFRRGFSQKLLRATEVIVEVKGGEGGDDSKLFAHVLFSAISKYARRNGIKVKVLGTANGHLVGQFLGKDVWRLMRSQVGTHCVQRVPPTETKGRRHTSYLSVAVLPIMELHCRPLDSSEVEVKTQGGHGPGGQHQNRRDSAVRVTHRPTRIQVFVNGRSQHANRAEAMRILSVRVNDHLRQIADDGYRRLRAHQFGNQGRGGKIRTYNFVKDRAVDHRTNRKAPVGRVIQKGEFELLD